MLYGWRAKIGLMVMYDDPVSEANIDDIVTRAEGVATYTARLSYPYDECTVEGLSELYNDVDKAASQLGCPAINPDVINFTCTSASVVIGEQKLLDAISKNAPNCIPTTNITAVKNAFKELGVKKVAMGTPYVDEINEIEIKHLNASGFELVNVEGLQEPSSFKICTTSSEAVYSLARRVDTPEADCVFISCGGLNLLPIIEQLENDLGKPVVSSNLAVAWDVLRKSGISDKISDCGELLRR